MREEWKPTPNNQYLISSHGRVYTHDRLIRTCGSMKNFTYRTRRGHILKLSLSNTGYYRFNYNGCICLVHRFVASMFIKNPDNLATVNHIDGNKQNNNVLNLEWLSNNDNVRHAWLTGLTGNQKPVRCIETGRSYNSITDAANASSLVNSNLVAHLKGNQKTFGGCHWEYI